MDSAGGRVAGSGWRWMAPRSCCPAPSVHCRPASGHSGINALIKRVLEDDTLPEMARDLFQFQAREYAAVEARLDDIETKLMKWHRQDDVSRRLSTIPGVGPIGSIMLSMKAPPPETSGRAATSLPGSGSHPRIIRQAAGRSTAASPRPEIQCSDQL